MSKLKIATVLLVIISVSCLAVGTYLTITSNELSVNGIAFIFNSTGGLLLIVSMATNGHLH